LTRIENSIEINAPPEKVWSMIQWDKMAEWLPSIKKVGWTSENHLAGATVEVKSELAGIKGVMDVETTEYVENEKLAWRARNFKMSGARALSPITKGTKVDIVDEYEMPYSILGKLIDKLRFRKAVVRNNEIGLNKLKAMLEE
jgi:carbon monoxide dehydrogenase subunit G